MSKIVYVVHGFNVSDQGAATVDRLKPYLEAAGLRPVDVDYGWFGLGRVRLCNKNVARVFASMAEPGSYAVGHSNGCALIHQAAHLGAQFSRVAYINPALNRSAPLAACINRADVWHSKSDPWPRLSRWLLRHQWGSMGAHGYSGTDHRYRNHNKEYGPRPSSGHSDVFTPELLSYWGPLIAEALVN